MNAILVAKNSTNQLIYLHPRISREELAGLREREQFFCPGCGGSLLLKIGTIKIPHFSHKTHSECATFSEPESLAHLHGKSMLHTFFSQNHHHVELEKYFPQIRQRADLLIDQKFAVEFQCSPIPTNQIQARSAGYISAGVKPLWLLSAKAPLTEGIQLIKLKAFEQALIGKGNSCSFLLAFDPSANNFHYYSSLFFISGYHWIAKTKSLAAEKQVFPFAQPRKLTIAEFSQVTELAYAARKRFVRSQQFVQNRFRKRFWRLCYELRLDANSLPLTMGIPLIKNHLLADNPVLWQLQAVLADSNGFSMNQLLSLGQVKLTAEATEQEALAHLEQYMEIHRLMKKQETNEALLLELLYDNYCKNV